MDNPYDWGLKQEAAFLDRKHRNEKREELKSSTLELDLISFDKLTHLAENPEKEPDPDKPLTRLSQAQIDRVLTELNVACHMNDSMVSLPLAELSHLLRAWFLCRLIKQSTDWDNLCEEDKEVSPLNSLKAIYNLVKDRV